jgi:hypothetical protein
MRFVKGFSGIQLLTRKPRKVLPFQMAVGQVQESKSDTIREVKVLQMEMNNYLKMYFNKSYMFDTIDERSGSKKGDIVLVKKIKNPVSQTMLYEVEKVLFKIDDIVDPVTGKRATETSDILAKHLKEFKKTVNADK